MFPLFLLKWVWASARFEAFGRTPGHRRLAKCDAGPPFEGGFFPAAAGILCAALELARTSAQRGLFRLRRAHTRSWGTKPHTAATRASRRGAGARPAGRVDRVDFPHGGKIGTFGTLEGNPPFAVAAVRLC